MRNSHFERYIGKPFVSGARGPDAYDCWGLVLAVYAEVYGIRLPDYDIAADALHQITRQISAEIATPLWTVTNPDEAPSVAVMALHEDHPHLANHCGVCLGGCVLHTTQNAGVHSFRVPSRVWAGRIMGYYRWTGLTATAKAA